MTIFHHSAVSQFCYFAISLNSINERFPWYAEKKRKKHISMANSHIFFI